MESKPSLASRPTVRKILPAELSSVPANSLLPIVEADTVLESPRQGSETGHLARLKTIEPPEAILHRRVLSPRHRPSPHAFWHSGHLTDLALVARRWQLAAKESCPPLAGVHSQPRDLWLLKVAVYSCARPMGDVGVAVERSMAS